MNHHKAGISFSSFLLLVHPSLSISILLFCTVLLVASSSIQGRHLASFFFSCHSPGILVPCPSSFLRMINNSSTLFRKKYALCPLLLYIRYDHQAHPPKINNLRQHLIVPYITLELIQSSTTHIINNSNTLYRIIPAYIHCYILYDHQHTHPKLSNYNDDI
jgi:hypothetical protein